MAQLQPSHQTLEKPRVDLSENDVSGQSCDSFETTVTVIIDNALYGSQIKTDGSNNRGLNRNAVYGMVHTMLAIDGYIYSGVEIVDNKVDKSHFHAELN